MLKNMKPVYLALVTIGSMGLTAMPTHACKEITAVALQGSDAAELRVRVNNVILINHKGSHSNTVPANLLLEGDNDFKIELITDSPDATGRAEVFVACEGDFPKEPGKNENVLAELYQQGAGEQNAIFQAKTQPAFSYLTGEITSDEGLLEAIEMMRNAAEAGDAKGYMAFFEPMFTDLPLAGGPPPEMIKGMVSELLSGKYTIKSSKDVQVNKILGGRAYQVVNSQDQGPIQFEEKTDVATGRTTITQGAFWLKTANGWKVFRP
ncbi:hypothetical protein [Kiloniella sp.]|uniref:hypothetical protein n=1 Tax=Kiloniella sp. TaxID=1938587 RepID=UPI003A8CB45C